MLRLKNELIASRGFQQALAQLAQQKLPVKAAFDMKVLLGRIEQKIKDSDKVKIDLMLRYCQKDEKGELKPFMDKVAGENGEVVEVARPGTVVPIPETKEEFEAKFKEFLEYEHEIKGHKFSAHDLADVVLTTAEAHILEPIFDFGEEAEETGKVLPLKS